MVGFSGKKIEPLTLCCQGFCVLFGKIHARGVECSTEHGLPVTPFSFLPLKGINVEI
jgi:hypothetical protein